MQLLQFRWNRKIWMKIAVDVIWVLPCSRALCQDNRQLIELAINLTHLIHPASKSIALNLFYSAWPNSLSKSPLMCFGFHGAKSSVWTLDIYIFFIRQYYPSQTKKRCLWCIGQPQAALEGLKAHWWPPLFRMPHFSGRAYICDMLKIIDD